MCSKTKRRISRVDIQVWILTAAIVIVSCGLIFIVNYQLSYRDMINSLQDRVLNIYSYLDDRLDKQSFKELNTGEDEQSTLYSDTKRLLADVKSATGVRYLYTAKETDGGEFIYQVDGLPSDSEDFRHVGDPIEPEIIPDMRKALQGQHVMPSQIKGTSWGNIFISYMPIHDGDQVIGVLGVEFDAQHQYTTFRLLRILTPAVIVLFCVIAAVIAVTLFKRISNPTYQDLANTDLLTGLKNRNAFETDLSNLDRGEKRRGTGILSADLDHLKLINDRFGHAEGDRYIQSAAALLKEACGEGRAVYRIGGDEFAVLFRSEPEQALAAVAEDISRTAERLYSGENAGGEEISMGLSVGCAVFDPQEDAGLFDALKRADHRMYDDKRTKNTGR